MPDPVITPPLEPSKDVDVSDRSISALRKMLESGDVPAPVVVVPEPVPAPDPVDPGPDKKSEDNDKPSDAAEAEKPTADDIPASDSESEKQKEPDEDSKPASRGIEKRFKTLTSKVARLQAELASRPVPATETESGTASPAPADGSASKPKPKAEDFSTYDEYTEGLANWTYDQREAVRMKADTATKAKERVESETAAWNANKATAIAADEALEDFDEVVGNASIPTSPDIYEAIVTSKQGPQIAYYLAQHPEECAALEQMPSVAAIRAIGQLEAKLTPVVKPVPVPKAQAAPLPKPPTNVGGKSAPASPDINDPNISVADLKKLANASLSPRNRF
jgi:hypothetical protein